MGFLTNRRKYMLSLNQVMLIGYLGTDPNILTNTETEAFVKLSLATTKKYTHANGHLQQDTQWHTVYVSNALGKSVAAHLKKGAKIFVSGELKAHTWQSKDNQKHVTWGVYAKELMFLDTKPKEVTTAMNITQDDLEYSAIQPPSQQVY
jgi:single-strand DNA-binding protein